MNNMHCGGAEKALVSLLQSLDYSKYEVDLFLFKNEGILLKQLPKEVTILPQPENYTYFDMSLKKAIIENLKKGNLKVVWYRILAGIVYKTEKIKTVKEQKVWAYLKKVLPSLAKTYDVAIGYLEKTPHYFCIDKVQASKKIGFIHNDYKMLQLDKKIDYPYFLKSDYIVTISEVCQAILKEVFPDFASKIKLMHNISLPETIKKLSNQTTELSDAYFSIVSIGRLQEQKGFDTAIQACKILVDSGLNVKWYIIGEGGQRGYLETLIKANQLESHFILLGLKENPYPYVRMATVYAQPSRFEGKSIAIDEAKILHKPILVTNFPSAGDQIENGKTGVIVGMDPQAIASGIAHLLLNEEFTNSLVKNLQKETLGNQSEIEMFYSLVNV